MDQTVGGDGEGRIDRPDSPILAPNDFRTYFTLLSIAHILHPVIGLHDVLLWQLFFGSFVANQHFLPLVPGESVVHTRQNSTGGSFFGGGHFK